MNDRSVFSGNLISLLLIFFVTGCFISCKTASNSYESTVVGNHFSGKYVEGDGDVKILDALNAAFESTRPSPKMANLPLLYKRDWNGYVEGPVWPCWWIQNTYGATYSMMPFLGEEPYASWIGNSQAMWFNLMGNNNRKDIRGLVGPDGCLCDAAFQWLNGGIKNGFGDPRLKGGAVGQELDGKISSEGVVYNQGDGAIDEDWFMGTTAAGLVLEADRLLVRHDITAAGERLDQLKRVAAFLDTRRDPEVNLLIGGKGSNLLAPSYAPRKKDGSIGQGYLTELSVNYVAGLERLAEVCDLCNQPVDAEKYRATAETVRQALPRLMTPQGYFIRGEDLAGTRRGVFGAKEHGYFEAQPNHYAGAFRVVDDKSNKQIIRFMLDSVKGPQEPGSLAPHGLIIPNYPGYDDHADENKNLKYGEWTDGGGWPAHQGTMDIACFRAGEFAHPFAAWAAMRPMMEAFRAETPLRSWGLLPWNGTLRQPYNIVYDCWGASGGLLRALFEYEYTAKGVRLWPHIPPGITRLVQKIPASFGQTRIFIAATGVGKPVKAIVDGKAFTMESDGSVFLPLDGLSKQTKVEFLLGDAVSKGVPVNIIKTIIPRVGDREFWNQVPKLDSASTSASFAAAGKFLVSMEKAGYGESFEAGQARVVVEVLSALHERRRLANQGLLRIPQLEGIPAAKADEVDKLYARQARFILGGLQDHLQGMSLQRYPVKPEVLQIAKEAGLIAKDMSVLPKSLHFSFHVYDTITIRKNPTTQVGITIESWPGNTFILWLPEVVGNLWQQWNAKVAHQDFISTDKGGLLWTFNDNPEGLIRTELIPQKNSLLFETQVTNRGKGELLKLYVQNCLHFSKAPDFICDDFSRIFIRTNNKWCSMASLNPTVSYPYYFRVGYPSRGRIDPDPTEHKAGGVRQAASIDHPLIVLVSKDGTRAVGVASEDYEFLFHNNGLEYLRCIHSESGCSPPVLTGEKVTFRQKVYFVNGGLIDCVAAFEKDIVGDPATEFRFKK